MRELSKLELQFMSGGYEPAYSTQEISTLSTLTGYTLGTVVNGFRHRHYRSSVVGLAATIGFCDKGTKSFIYIASLFVHATNSMHMVANFGCGLFSGMSERAPRE